MTPSLRGWEAFPMPGALTHTRITWALSPPAPQVPGVTPGSPLCPWCFGHPFGEVRDTLANTLFGALSGPRPVNWGLLIHEVVAKALSHMGKKPLFLSPFLYHLYHQYDMLVPDEEDELTIAAEEVTYKL